MIGSEAGRLAVSGAGPAVLIVAASARALAASAVRAGWSCAAVDAFGDLDLPPARAPTGGAAPAAAVARTGSARALSRAASSVTAPALVYGAPFENHPSALERLAAGRALWGTPPPALRAARDPRRLARALRRAGILFPPTLGPTEARRADPRRSWLRKPRRGGGGLGIAGWRPGEPLRAREVVQERIAGEPGSVLAAADGRRAVVLGLSRQLLGRRAFGVSGLRWCGNLFPLQTPPGTAEALLGAAESAASALAETFGLRGLFGIDFVHRAGRLTVIEVNPRPTASMELLEDREGLSVFAAHVRACRGELPEPPGRRAAAGRGVLGKAVVFATRPLLAGDARPWRRLGARDLPRPGSRIPRGGPICTVTAEGPDARSCLRALARRAALIRRRAEAGVPAGAP